MIRFLFTQGFVAYVLLLAFAYFMFGVGGIVSVVVIFLLLAKV
jgi:hypothetical protein